MNIFQSYHTSTEDEWMNDFLRMEENSAIYRHARLTSQNPASHRKWTGGTRKGGNVTAAQGKMDALNKLKQFDAYPKTLEDFRIKTCGGATGGYFWIL